MNVWKAQLRNSAAILIALSLAVSASAEAKRNSDPTSVGIRNFGKMNDNYFRGAQPDDEDFASLARSGIRTVIDLTKDGKKDERRLVERAGMKFYRIPMTTSDRPSNAAVTQFLKLVNDPDNWPVYVHCQGGRHRTGAMTAVYRMTQDGWSADRAYQEMKRYKFEGFPGHPELKKFVYNYYSRLARTQPSNAAQKRAGANN